MHLITYFKNGNETFEQQKFPGSKCCYTEKLYTYIYVKNVKLLISGQSLMML